MADRSIEPTDATALAGLTRAELRARLAVATERGDALVDGDHHAAVRRAAFGVRATPAAVLIGMVERPDGPAILLTQRTDHLRDHAGQICFPGGRIEPEDPTIEAAALREAAEEIGLPPGQVELLGQLPAYDTTTGFRIHPVVGWITAPVSFALDPVEVAEVFELPLGFVLDPANHERHSYRRGRQTRSYYVLPYQNRFIWGATAGILVNLSMLLRA
jgi:8-oxo-dGTP pyrophosphatase MutT (NUDIX family)